MLCVALSSQIRFGSNGDPFVGRFGPTPEDPIDGQSVRLART